MGAVFCKGQPQVILYRHGGTKMVDRNQTKTRLVINPIIDYPRQQNHKAGRIRIGETGPEDSPDSLEMNHIYGVSTQSG
jgi:hypothetical protein